jgi:O-methyltransferase involved in polyketide biosynthesis
LSSAWVSGVRASTLLLAHAGIPVTLLEKNRYLGGSCAGYEAWIPNRFRHPHGRARDIPDVQDLWYFEEREDVDTWLRRYGWDVTVTPAEELMARYDRRPPRDIEDAAPKTLFVAAEQAGRK